MTVYFAGSEYDSYSHSGTGPQQTTTSTRRDPIHSRIAMRPIDTGRMTANFTSKLTTGWFHARIIANESGSSLSDLEWILLRDVSAGLTAVQMDSDNGFMNMEYYNGAGFTELGGIDGRGLRLSNDHTGGIALDIHWNIADSGGFYRMYHDGNLIGQFEGDTKLGTLTGIDSAILGPQGTFFNDQQTIFYTEVIVADVETIGWHLSTLNPDGIGNSTTWTGDHTSVNASASNDGTFVSSTLDDELEQFTCSNLPTSLDVKAFVITSRSRNVAVGPQNLQMSLRTGGTDFTSANLPISASFINSGPIIYDLNPDTVAAWTTAEIDAIEIGVISRT